jgi:hypothetical protein
MGGRRFTPGEDDRLLELRMIYAGHLKKKVLQMYPNTKKGGLRAIAREMGRPVSSVQMRLNYLANCYDPL